MPIIPVLPTGLIATGGTDELMNRNLDTCDALTHPTVYIFCLQNSMYYNNIEMQL